MFEVLEEEDKVLKVESDLPHKEPARGQVWGIANINDFNVFFTRIKKKTDFHMHKSYIQNIKHNHF